MFDGTGTAALLVLFLAILSAGLFFLHAVRIRAFAGPFVMYLAFLWFLSFLTGGLNYAFSFPLFDLPVTIRLSSAIFTLIFVGILIVYVTEGVRESQNLIFVSLGAQLILVLTQVFLFHAGGALLEESTRGLATAIFEPRYARLSIGVAVAAVDLFFAITFFQFLVNRLPRWPLGLLLFAALWATMMLDSALFVAGTRLEFFAETMFSHAVFKTLIVLVVSGPLALYMRWFQRIGNLNLKRGSLDIFRRIADLEADLKKANAELRNYADHLEDMVALRTAEIQEKQKILDFELEMAAEVQRTMLPEADRLRALDTHVIYRPHSTVSGDLYDLGLFSENQAFFFIGDISGHGVPAALVAAMCKMSLSRINLRSTRPAEILARLSRTLTPVTDTHYLTGVFFSVDINAHELVYANGAHVSPMLAGPSGQVTQLPPTGPVIGTAFSDEFTQKRVRYAPGSRLVVFTDGLTEHRSPAGEEFGPDRLMEAIGASRSLAPRESAEYIVAAVQAFAAGANFRDDVTLIVADLS